MSITVVEPDERLERLLKEGRWPRDSKYPPIYMGTDRSGFRTCLVGGSLVVSKSPETVESLVKEIVDRMRRMGMYVDPDKTIG